MEQLIDDISGIEGVKAVRRSGNVLKIELFGRKIPDSELVEISGDLRKISQKLNSTLDSHADKGNIRKWNWIDKPKKRYDETSLGDSVTDRKPRGHRPGHYQIEVRE